MSGNAPPVPGNKEVMSVGNWFVTLLITMIPCVGIIMYFVWAFGAGNENRRNFCRAGILMSLIGIAISVVLMVFFWAAISSLAFFDF